MANSMIVLFLISLDNVKNILKVVRFGFVSVAFFILFIFYKFCLNISDNGSIANISAKGHVFNVSSGLYTEAAGFCALSFIN